MISIHALREEGDRASCRRPTPSTYFYPRPPRGGRQTVLGLLDSRTPYFYPRPPRGGRQAMAYTARYTTKFLSTPSARRATTLKRSARWTPTNFYPRPPRGGRPDKRVCKGVILIISIHALREEGDRPTNLPLILPNRFLSTPSARRATGLLHKGQPPCSNFYPRPPRGGRQA